MNAKAVSQGAGEIRPKVALGLCLAAAAALLAVACTSASAAPIPGRNGQIHACYKAKGKAKGAMRVVAGKRCRRGERRLAWSVSGPPGAVGAGGAQGGQGTAGAQGAPGSGAGGGTTMASLETKVASLSLEVETLKKLLQGVGSGDLEGLVNGLPALQSSVSGLTSTVSGLGSTVTGLTSKTNSLCTQASGLTTGLNELNAGTGAMKVLGLVGLSLDTTSLPEELGSFTCP